MEEQTSWLDRIEKGLRHLALRMDRVDDRGDTVPLSFHAFLHSCHILGTMHEIGMGKGTNIGFSSF